MANIDQGGSGRRPAAPGRSEPVRTRQPSSASGKPALADGCYLLQYAFPGIDDIAYDGTLRADSRSGPLVASADLYLRASLPSDSASPGGLVPAPDPAAGIPSFPINAYRYYLRVTALEPIDNGFTLTFEAHRYGTPGVTLLTGDTVEWVFEDTYTAQMLTTETPSGFPAGAPCFMGDVMTDQGAVLGQLQLGWLSPSLRKATIEIDRVPESELPLDNGAGSTWTAIFAALGWDVTVDVSDSDVGNPHGATWTAADAHAAMLARRDRYDLDAEWRYHVLAVQYIDYPDGERGVMYDLPGHDENRVAREGLMVSSHFVFPPAEEKWGLVRGQRAGRTVSYFRSAVHEIGHAMGLSHDERGTFFMRPTDKIAEQGSAATPFPTNITWAYSPEAEHRLRHWPDVVVRPGGAVLRNNQVAPLVALPGAPG